MGHADGFDYEPRGCLNLRWNADGSLECIHDDHTVCDLGSHTTISTYVRRSDLTPPLLHTCDVAECEQSFPTMAEVIEHERTHAR